MGLGSIALIAGLVLNPFGTGSDHLTPGKPEYAFEGQGPVLHLVRVEKVPAQDCKAWVDGLMSVPKGELTPIAGPETLRKAWEPLSEKELKAIKGCDGFPCKVKFNEAEAQAMKKASEGDRVARFYDLVTARMDQYRKTQVRKAYETPGDPPRDPIDPWAMLESKGFKPAEKRPDQPVLFARKLNFNPEKMLTIHQIIDRRASRAVSGNEAVVWVRDAYTDHYFDSWGEWSFVHCDPARKEVVVIQSLLAEMDLLKGKSIFAHAAFGRYRSAFQENGKTYLDTHFEALKKLPQ